MLSGAPPFDDDEGLYRQISEGKFEFDVPAWSVVSLEAKELVQQLLKVNPRERLTIQQALEHPWLSQDESSNNPETASEQLVSTDMRAAKRRRTDNSTADIEVQSSSDQAMGHKT